MSLHWSVPTQIANVTVLFLLAASLSARAPMLSQAEQSTFPTTNVIEPYSLPVAYPLSLQSQDADIQNQIRNTLAHYPLAIDGKNFDALDRVFTKDAVANYSAPLNVVRGLSQIQLVLKQTLAPVLSQHAYGTQVIEVLEGSRSAKSVTYFTASQFGTGNKAGKVYYSYGQYQDNLVKVGDEWRIKHRNLVYMGPGIGDISIYSNISGT